MFKFKIIRYGWEKVYHIDYACDSDLFICEDDSKTGILSMNHELIDFKLLDIMNNGDKQKSDFENELGEIGINFSTDANEISYKAIGTFQVRMEDGLDKKVKLIFYKMKFLRGTTDNGNTTYLKFDSEKIHKHSTKFKIIPDEDGKLVTLKTVI